MKIICEKGCNAGKMMQFITEFIEKRSLEYPFLKENLELMISFEDGEERECPENEHTYYFGEKEIENLPVLERGVEYYYTHDALTGLYNRGKYEKDIEMFQTAGYHVLSCIYIDAVGLHEVNNHLGHQAGDQMLCQIADGIRQQFAQDLTYRIGGDEFVILCLNKKMDQIKEKTEQLRISLSEKEHEISVGIGESHDCRTLTDTVNAAEDAMRLDKQEFYRKNGAERQMRTLNKKLEKILLEKQDARQFLNVIAPRYKGVYMVDPDTDTCRYIYIPPYFKQMLKENKGSFQSAIKDYCEQIVRPEYHERFLRLYDYEGILHQLRDGSMLDMTYQKNDGNWVRLKITIYDQEARDSREMLWIFADDN